MKVKFWMVQPLNTSPPYTMVMGMLTVFRLVQFSNTLPLMWSRESGSAIEVIWVSAKARLPRVVRFSLKVMVDICAPSKTLSPISSRDSGSWTMLEGLRYMKSPMVLMPGPRVRM